MPESNAKRDEATGEAMTIEMIEAFITVMREKKRGQSSLENYHRILMSVYDWLPEGKILDENTGSERRRWLLEEKGFSHRTVNAQMSVLNSFLRYLGHRDWQVDEFVREDNIVQPELTRTEYLRLLAAAKRMGKEKIYLLIKTMGGAGVRVQELAQVTAEAVIQGMVKLDSHNGMRLRIMVMPKALQGELLEYIHKENIVAGPVFLSRDGRPLSRTTIHHYVNSVSREAMVDAEKANPRCLWKMYQSTQDGIQANINVLIRQAYENMMDKEQLTIGWDA